MTGGAREALQRARTEGGSTSAKSAVDVGAERPAYEERADASPPRFSLGQISVQATSAPPQNVAVLHVFRHSLPGDRLAFSVLAESAYGGLDDASPRGRPRLVLAQLAQNVDPTTTRMPSQILAALLDWSMDNHDVSEWINGLRRQRPDDLYLVIIDHTGFEMPWELLELPGETPADGRVYLGTKLPVARWQTIQNNITFKVVPLDFARRDRPGDVVAYVDAAELSGGGPERHTLRRLGADLRDGLRDLTGCLTTERDDLALVYIAAHGHWAPSVLDLAIGSRETDQLVLGLMRGEPLPALTGSEAIVFLNVCHSGRLFQEHEFLDTDRLRGFPELFVGHGAKGVLATTGWVNDASAGELAEWLLTRLTGDDPPSICEALREWRERAWLDSLAEPNEPNKAKLLNACMYVYYGSPMARLRLNRRDA